MFRRGRFETEGLELSAEDREKESWKDIGGAVARGTARREVLVLPVLAARRLGLAASIA